MPFGSPSNKSKPTTTVSTEDTIVAPIEGNPAAGTSSGQVYGASRDGGSRLHAGVDVPVPAGTSCYAPVDGLITSVNTTTGFSGGGMIHFQFLESLGSIPKGACIGWGHISETLVSSGPVKAGTEIAKSGTGAGGDCVHFVYLPGGDSQGSQWDGTADPTPAYDYLRTGKATPGASGVSGDPLHAGVSSTADIEAISKAAAISSFLNLPGLLNRAESLALEGERSLMNDEPLMPFIEQLCQASLRNFQSMPNGNFFAFVPDYFGGLNHRTPYWYIEDIEIIDGHIDLTDDALATHVFVAGDTGVPDGQIDQLEKMFTVGVVNVINAFMADFLNGIHSPQIQRMKNDSEIPKQVQQKYEKDLENYPTLAQKDKAIAFLKKYGARPYYEDAPMVRSHFFEMFLAYQKFCMLWSKQFLTTFEFTFMPELFPGGLVAFPDHGIQCYIDEVSHEGSYESGFVTRANLSAPTALGKSGRKNVHEGMIRAGAFDTKPNNAKR